MEVSSQIVQCISKHEGVSLKEISDLCSISKQQCSGALNYLKKHEVIILKEHKYYLRPKTFGQFIIRLHHDHHLFIFDTFDQIVEQRKKLIDSKTKFAIYSKVCEE